MSLQRAVVRLLLNTSMSLADLQVATQVSLPTLRRAVQELSDARWIRVVGQAEANGGRPAMLFGVDDSRFAIVGVHLQLPGVRLVLTDLAGHVLEETELLDDRVPSPEESVQAVVAYMARIKSAFPEREILGVGVATPGFIDLETGDILAIGRVPTWEGYPMRQRLQTALKVPVTIANDVDCMAIAELYHSRELQAANLVYVGFDEGVKVTFFLRGELYKSTLGNAGLVSAPLLSVPSIQQPGDVGRLLTIQGVSTLFAERMAALDRPAQAHYAEITAIASLRERVHRILASASAELPACRTLVHEQIKVLAVVVANVLLLIQPDLVVVGGLLSALPHDLFLDLETAIRQHTPALISNNTIVRQGKLASHSSAAIGAGRHFLQVHLAESGPDL